VSTERLQWLIDVLGDSDPVEIPAASADYLRQSLARGQAGPKLYFERVFQCDGAPARKARDELLRQCAAEIPAYSHWERARIVAAEAARIHSGRRSRFGWITAADALARLPESPRRYVDLLR